MVEENSTEHRKWTRKEKGQLFRKQVAEEGKRIRDVLERAGSPAPRDESAQAAIKRAATYRVSGQWQKDRLRKEGFTDPLTGLDNRRSFERTLQREIAEAKRSGKKLGVILADLDHLKEINDQHGHLAGDDVLRGVAKLLKEKSRLEDLVARWGGEEFGLILPDAGRDELQIAAERLRTALENTPIEARTNLGKKSLKITASFGGAIFERNDDETSLMLKADSALYEAKENGRNVVIIK